MPTQKDIEFAKLLASKDLISKAEMQRLLDELDDLRKKDPRISVEVFMIKNKVITNHELKIIKESSKQRIVHCSKCRTMYRVSQEDVGKRFKCKTCSTAVIVPMPGQTKTKSIRDLVEKEKKTTTSLDSRKVLKGVSKEEYEAQKQAAANAPEVTIELDEDDDNPIEATAATANNEGIVVSASEDNNEVMLATSADDDLDSALAVDDLHIPDMGGPEVTINLGTDDEDEEDDEDDVLPVLGKEVTIDLGLDDGHDDGELVAAEVTMNLEDHGHDFAEDDSNTELVVETTPDGSVAAGQEMTINLGLDDADEDDSDAELVVDVAPQVGGGQEMTMPVYTNASYDEEDSDSEMVVENLDVGSALVIDPTPQITPSQPAAGREMTINLGLDDTDNDEDDSDAELVVDMAAQVGGGQEMTMPVHTSNSYDDEDSDVEMVVDNLDVSGAAMVPSPAMTPTPQITPSQPAAGREMTINLGLDDTDNDEDDSDAELVVDMAAQVGGGQEMTMPVHTSNSYDDEDSDVEMVVDDLDVSGAAMTPSHATTPQVGGGQEMTMPVHTSNSYDDEDSDVEMVVDDLDVSGAAMAPSSAMTPTPQITPSQPAAGREMTINLGLDDTDNDEDDSDAELVVGGGQEMTMPVNTSDSYDDEDSDVEMVVDDLDVSGAAMTFPSSPDKQPRKPQQNRELTIDLGLDDSDDE
ncbi:hypothetical protein [Candidatus Uabimicrobium amorphum]|uniref:Uncharacterized protein n=1 Tax=Uabimicrobium amorphum TaxID=2596890 RepID=A0A5S9IVL6_UABAM|nr:hypothetical protein [Candidatus Uabimicrobium amorphum]BBM88102.1 hypothetical protein UABAM_06518 [Candidatus Uabimicrobium amorphum]